MRKKTHVPDSLQVLEQDWGAQLLCRSASSQSSFPLRNWRKSGTGHQNPSSPKHLSTLLSILHVYMEQWSDPSPTKRKLVQMGFEAKIKQSLHNVRTAETPASASVMNHYMTRECFRAQQQGNPLHSFLLGQLCDTVIGDLEPGRPESKSSLTYLLTVILGKSFHPVAPFSSSVKRAEKGNGKSLLKSSSHFIECWRFAKHLTGVISFDPHKNPVR